MGAQGFDRSLYCPLDGRDSFGLRTGPGISHGRTLGPGTALRIENGRKSLLHTACGVDHPSRGGLERECITGPSDDAVSVFDNLTIDCLNAAQGWKKNKADQERWFHIHHQRCQNPPNLQPFKKIR